MIIVRLKGGLGNQMFQYALGRVLAIKNNTELKLDTSFFNLDLKNVTKRGYNLNVFNIKAEIAKKYEVPFIFRISKNRIAIYFTSLFRKIIKNSGQEKSFTFDINVLSLGRDVYLDGYWQSYKYFKDFEEVIRKDFTLKNLPDKNIQDLVEEISSINSLCIHMRRGDYVDNKAHEVVTNNYYTTGIEKISSMTAVEKIYVFSDDIEWCKNNLKFALPTMFVGDEYAGEIGEAHMYLMSKCKYFIIANSSFSWWAAWLSGYKDKIILCPKQWFGNASINTDDLIPESWIRL